jgi:hypothetical protein
MRRHCIGIPGNAITGIKAGTETELLSIRLAFMFYINTLEEP